MDGHEILKTKQVVNCTLLFYFRDGRTLVFLFYYLFILLLRQFESTMKGLFCTVELVFSLLLIGSSMPRQVDLMEMTQRNDT